MKRLWSGRAFSEFGSMEDVFETMTGTKLVQVKRTQCKTKVGLVVVTNDGQVLVHKPDGRQEIYTLNDNIQT